MRSINQITDEHINVLACTWAIVNNKPMKPYKYIIEQVRDGKRDIEDLPFFMVRHIYDLNYETPLKNIN